MRANLDAFSNVLKELEIDIPFDLAPPPSDASSVDQLSTINSLGKALYFGVPRNEKLLSYWDLVADRLFKIRNSLNSQGIFRQLPLFDPPIDPALLAKAAASGLDVGTIVSGINQPLSLVRFWVLVQKAAEICQEVKSLGNNLLSAIEKEDNEALSILRAQHESDILKKAEIVKYEQWQETIKNREGLEQSLVNTSQRYLYYEQLLGKPATKAMADIPKLEGLDAELLEKMKFRSDEPQMPLRPIAVDIAQEESGSAGNVGGSLSFNLGAIIGGAVGGVVGGPVGSLIGAAIGNALIDPVTVVDASADPGAADITGGKKLNSYEARELAHLNVAHALQGASGELERTASGLNLLLQLNVHGTPIGVGVAVGFGGDQLSRMVSMIASAVRSTADQQTFKANNAAKIGAYARREQDWLFQSNLAAGEITQIFKQLQAAQIREHMAEREWKNHQQQIQNAEAIERFFTDEKKGKTTNIAFYAWLKGEVKAFCMLSAFSLPSRLPGKPNAPCSMS